jgi:hypothetical protein
MRGILPCMTDKASRDHAGWVVRVTTPEPFSGDKVPPEIWDVAIPDRSEAVKEVSERIRAIDERVEAVEELSANRIKGFGLKRGQAKQRL